MLKNKKYLVYGLIVIVVISSVGFATYAVLNNNPDSQKEETVHPPGHASQQSSKDSLATDYGDLYDIDFSRKAILYNQQAIEMSAMLKSKSADTALSEWAQERSNLLESEVNRYKTLLDGWKESYRELSSFPRSDEHDGYYSDIGFATAEDKSSLGQLTAQELEVKYKSLMAAHHEGFLLLVQTNGANASKTETAELRDQSEKQYKKALSFLKA